MDPIVDAMRRQRREQRENARPDGTNIARLVKKVREALVNINATVIAATNSYLATGTVNMANLVISSLTASGNVTASGRVTSAAALRSPGSRAQLVSSNWAGAWIDGDGTIAISPSSRRFKTDIVPWQPDITRLLELQAVLFRYDLPEMPPDAPLQLGFIAEDLEDLGFTEFLFYDGDGLVEGINYDRLTVALLMLAQQQDARLVALEQWRAGA